MTPLHLAAMTGYQQCAMALISHGADPYVHVQGSEYHGDTPADIARARGHAQLADALRTAALESEVQYTLK